MNYPQFKEDLEVLVAEGYVKITGPETCEWIKSKTSLAEYFKWTGYDAEWVTGGFWAPIARCFGEDQRSLSRLASNNANPQTGILQGFYQNQGNLGEASQESGNEGCRKANLQLHKKAD
jgi:hypothetical protein